MSDSYPFNPHRHVKIWLTKDKDIFLNLENQLRLVRVRELNPNDEISFLYESRLLSDTALAALRIFCAKNKISAKDIHSDIIPLCETQYEQNLLTIYEGEIANFSQGVGLSVPSDILRVLKPVYSLGTYSDFDVAIDTRQLPAVVPVNGYLLCNLGSLQHVKNYETPYFNWDIFAVVDEPAALPTIQKVQASLYAACLRQEANQPSSYLRKMLQYASALDRILPPVAAVWLFNIFKNSPEIATQLQLHNMALGKSSLELRQTIVAQTESNIIFSRLVFPEATGSNTDIIHRVAIMKRQEIKKQLTWTNWFLMTRTEYQSLKSLAAIRDNDVFVTKLRLQQRQSLLKQSVLCTSGPGVAFCTLFPEVLYSLEEGKQRIVPYSLCTYGLDKAFLSQNGVPMHATQKKLLTLLNGKIGETNDVSWLEEGRQKIHTREHRMMQATTKIQGFFKRQKVVQREAIPIKLVALENRINTHIEKIQHDLTGYFGFYRRHQRQEKIKALKGMLTHFYEGHFDIEAFRLALPSYQTDAVFASIGQSETKALCDELIRVSKQATMFSVSDSDGRAALPGHLR